MSIIRTAVLLLLLVIGMVSMGWGCDSVGRELVGEISSDAADSGEPQDSSMLAICAPNNK